jgi:hypothetical protein
MKAAPTIGAVQVGALQSVSYELQELARLLNEHVAAHASEGGHWLQGLAVRLFALSSVVIHAAEPEDDIEAMLVQLHGHRSVWPAAVQAIADAHRKAAAKRQARARASAGEQPGGQGAQRGPGAPILHLAARQAGRTQAPRPEQ